MKNTKTIRCWHFVGDQLRDGSSIPENGVWLRADGEIRPGTAGLHGCRDPFDALRYASGATLCLVELREDIIEAPEMDDLVARSRRILARRDMRRELRLFACQCVRKMPLGDGRTVWDLLTDERSRRAVEVAESYASNNVTVEEFASARAAARDAAWDAAWAAAWAAARTAAWAAAMAAAMAVARDVPWDVAWASATAWHRKQFRQVVRAAFADVPAAAAVLDELEVSGE